VEPREGAKGNGAIKSSMHWAIHGQKTMVALAWCAVRLAHGELMATLVLPWGVVEVSSP